MVGSAILRELKKSSFTNIIAPNSKQLNLLNQLEVERFFEETKPDYIFAVCLKLVGYMQMINFLPNSFMKISKFKII